MDKFINIKKLLEHTEYPILSYKEYNHIISSIQEIWGYKTKTRDEISEILTKEDQITIENLVGQKGELYSVFIKKNIENFDVFDIASARSRNSYFSYFSALYINALTLQIPKQIFMTLERTQLYKTLAISKVHQSSVDKSFSKSPRITQNKRYYKQYSINLVHGQKQNNIGVIPFKEIYQVSDIERTLIDVSVRPFYCGGVSQVLEAFVSARKRIDIDKLYYYYSKMNFIYPYNNIIGFYLEHAGYHESEILAFRKMRNFDIKIYLTYNIQNPILSESWNIYYPKGLV